MTTNDTTTQEPSVRKLANPLPPTVLINKEESPSTLFNVLNALSVIKEVMDEREYNCADRGITLLLTECINAINWEATRIDESRLQAKRQTMDKAIFETPNCQHINIQEMAAIKTDLTDIVTYELLDILTAAEGIQEVASAALLDIGGKKSNEALLFAIGHCAKVIVGLQKDIEGKIEDLVDGPSSDSLGVQS